MMSNHDGSNLELNTSQVCLLIKAMLVFAACFTEVRLLRDTLIWRGVIAVYAHSCQPHLSFGKFLWAALYWGW